MTHFRGQLQSLHGDLVFDVPPRRTRDAAAAARGGLLTLQRLPLDTKDTKLKGHGTMDLRRQQFDVTIEPYPQDFSLLSAHGPLHVIGTFADPSSSVEPSFPSPDFGTAEDSERCSGLVEALRRARKRRQ